MCLELRYVWDIEKLQSTISYQKEVKNTSFIAYFNWKDVSCMQDLGVGSFGTVHSAKFVQGTEKKTVVIKKVMKEGEML